MRETNAWAAVRSHLAPFGRLRRIEDRINTGTPDVIYCLRRRTGWLETKAGAAVTLEQVMFGEAWAAAGGRWHLLLRAPRAWGLYDAAGARHLFEKDAGREEAAKIWTTGPFPLRPMLDLLAPLS